MKKVEKASTAETIAMEINMLDADQNEHTTSAIETALAGMQEIVALDASEADKMRKLCACVRTCFDTILGEGMGRKACGERDNIEHHTQAFLALRKEAQRQREGYIQRAEKAAQA